MTTTNAEYQEPIKHPHRTLSLTEFAELHRKALKATEFTLAFRIHPLAIQLDALSRERSLQDAAIPNTRQL